LGKKATEERRKRGDRIRKKREATLLGSHRLFGVLKGRRNFSRRETHVEAIGKGKSGGIHEEMLLTACFIEVLQTT